MPAGNPWVSHAPRLRNVLTGEPFWHVYVESYGPLSGNPRSKARMALVDTHAMFYVADTLAGALWETVLRYIEPDEDRQVQIRPDLLKGMRAVQVRLKRDDVPLLELGQPGLRALFPIDSAESVAVAAMLHDPLHANTHAEARQLHVELSNAGMTEMPVLSWPSRQLSTSTVYLAYEPPMDASWWEVAGPAIALDDALDGHPALHRELARHGFTWTPLATTATPPAQP